MECEMERRFHRGFTAAEKTELWDRWKRGESLKAIGRAFRKPSSSIYFLVAPHGGIRPAERRRSRLALTLAEREVISRGVKGTSIGPVDRKATWPLTLDGEPGNEPQWRL
jgi:IS30 family transposase